MAVSILWTFAPSPFIDERSPVALVVALYVAAGVLMAVTFACLTAPARTAAVLPPLSSGRRPGSGRTEPPAVHSVGGCRVERDPAERTAPLTGAIEFAVHELVVEGHEEALGWRDRA